MKDFYDYKLLNEVVLTFVKSRSFKSEIRKYKKKLPITSLVQCCFFVNYELIVNEYKDYLFNYELYKNHIIK